MDVLSSLIKVAAILLGLVVYAAQPSVAARRVDRHAPAAPALYVGSQKIRAPALVDNGRVLVPARGVFEAIDASVDYTPPHFVVVRKRGAVIAAFSLDRRFAIVGRRGIELDAAPTRRNGRIYVPLRVVAEAVGATVAYGGRPAVIHIRPIDDVADPAIFADPAVVAEARAVQTAQAKSTMQWRVGVAVFTGLCCVCCLVLTARRFGPRLFGAPAPRPAIVPPPVPPLSAAPPPARVDLTSVEASGEARVRKELVTETRTVEVPLTREELVIEYAGEGGNVIFDGRELAAGETVRVPLWEERVQVDVTKHVLLTEDIVIGKRRTTVPAPQPAQRTEPERAAPPDFSIAEGSPS